MRINKSIVRLTFLILVILIFQNSFCQKNYLPGYIIKLNGDTLHGFIDYKNWEKNPNKMLFQERIGDEKIIFTPTDIKSFSVKDEIYVSAIIKSEVSPNHTDKMNFNPELKLISDTTFLQTMIQGTKSLYYYKNRNANENFYIKQNDEFDLLKQKKYLVKDINGRNLLTENRKYIGQLRIYLNDCPSIQSKLMRTKYNKQSLEQLFGFYYDCTKTGIKFQKKTEKLLVETGVLAGLSISSLKFNGNYYPFLVRIDFAKSYNFTTGLFLDVILPRNQRKLSIYNEFIIKSYKVEGRYDDFTSNNYYTINYIKIGYTYLKINTMFRYKQPVGKMFLYLNAGMSNGFAISETNNRKKESKFYSSHSTSDIKALPKTRKYEQGLIFGLGSTFKKYSFEIRYETGNGISDYTDLGSKTKSYYFLFGYRF